MYTIMETTSKGTALRQHTKNNICTCVKCVYATALFHGAEHPNRFSAPCFFCLKSALTMLTTNILIFFITCLESQISWFLLHIWNRVSLINHSNPNAPSEKLQEMKHDISPAVIYVKSAPILNMRCTRLLGALSWYIANTYQSKIIYSKDKVNTV